MEMMWLKISIGQSKNYDDKKNTDNMIKFISDCSLHSGIISFVSVNIPFTFLWHKELQTYFFNIQTTELTLIQTVIIQSIPVGENPGFESLLDSMSDNAVP